MTPTATKPAAGRVKLSVVDAAERAHADARVRVVNGEVGLADAVAEHQRLLDRLAAGDATVTAAELTAAEAARHRAELLAKAAMDDANRASEGITAAQTAELVTAAREFLDTDPARHVAQLQAVAQAAVDNARAAERTFRELSHQFGRRFRQAGLPCISTSGLRQDAVGAGYVGYDMPGAPVLGFVVDGRAVYIPTISWDPR